jgi:glyoxylate/hydroxypyruvate reductase A
MAIAVLVGKEAEETKRFDWFILQWKQVLLKLDPALDIRVWPDVGNVNEIDAAFVWRHPPGVLKQFPNLKLIASVAAGVDHVLADHDLPKNVPIVRVMDSYMANDIVQYVLATVLHYVKRLGDWELNQQQSLWSRSPPFNFSHKTIGIMGLGFLGKKAAYMLSQLGLKVIGWSQSPKQFDDIKTFAGQAQFHDFLSQADVLVCMLPLTPQTENILNQSTFSRLPKGAYLVNLGRGEHLVDQDCLAALASGQLSGACLDVFRQEPLPSEHSFWKAPNVRITPHIASVTNPETAAPQLLDNYQRAMAGQELLNRVNVEKGY